MGEQFYSPEQVARQWSVEKIKWLLRNYYELLLGYWPQNPQKPSGYIEYVLPPLKGRLWRKVRRKRMSYSAKAESIASIRGILEKRLQYAGRDSFLLIGAYTLNQSFEHLARCERTSEENIKNRMIAALNVMAGVETKKAMCPASRVGQR